MVEVVHPSDLAGNCYSFPIKCPDFSIVFHGLKSVLGPPSILSLALLSFLMGCKHHIGTNHDTCSSFSSFAVDGNNVFSMSFKIIVAVFAELENKFKWRWVVVIEGIVLTYRPLIKVIDIVFPLRAQIIYPVMVSVPMV